MSALKEQFTKTLVPGLKSELKLSNIHEVPTVTTVTVNVGLGKGLADAKYYDVVEQTLERITGQKPLKTLARKSIANFKVREGMVVGMKVTLHGKRMWDFLEKLVAVTFPRVRDFRGISESVVDQAGNMNLGFSEHIAFPEIRSDEIEMIHGLQVNVTTTARTREEGLALFRALGFTFKSHTK